MRAVADRDLPQLNEYLERAEELDMHESPVVEQARILKVCFA